MKSLVLPPGTPADYLSAPVVAGLDSAPPSVTHLHMQCKLAGRDFNGLPRSWNLIGARLLFLQPAATSFYSRLHLVTRCTSLVLLVVAHDERSGLFAL